jgi:hypothetical protein
MQWRTISRLNRAVCGSPKGPLDEGCGAVWPYIIRDVPSKARAGHAFAGSIITAGNQVGVVEPCTRSQCPNTREDVLAGGSGSVPQGTAYRINERKLILL